MLSTCSYTDLSKEEWSVKFPKPIKDFLTLTVKIIEGIIKIFSLDELLVFLKERKGIQLISLRYEFFMLKMVSAKTHQFIASPNMVLSTFHRK